MQFAVEEALDELYAAKPEDFTALRTKLAAAAKKSGDAEAARRISGSRKPTAAAWVVNALALQGTARTELTDLGSRLREAHAAMDGEAIRALTAEQRRLVDELTRTALRNSGLASPSGALRDDVTSTWQAARRVSKSSTIRASSAASPEGSPSRPGRPASSASADRCST